MCRPTGRYVDPLASRALPWPRRRLPPRPCRPPRPPISWLLAALACAAPLMVAGATAAQTGMDKSGEVGRFEAGPLDWPGEGTTPREIGRILEISDEAYYSGSSALNYMRHVARTCYDWLLHLRIAVVEADRPTINYDRENCQLLFELLQASDPSRVLQENLAMVREALATEAQDAPSALYLDLQLNVQKYEFLYPRSELRRMLSELMRSQRDGKMEEVRITIRMLEEAVALANIDEPLRRSQQAFQTAMAGLDAGRSEEARAKLKDAAKYMTLLNLGTYLRSSLWYLGKAIDATENGLYTLGSASVREASKRLEDAEDRAWEEFALKIATVRSELEDFSDALQDRERKVTLSCSRLRELAKRIDTELLIPL
jgi:hypothetical protein